MKRIIVIILATVLSVSLTACGSKDVAMPGSAPIPRGNNEQTDASTDIRENSPGSQSHAGTDEFIPDYRPGYANHYGFDINAMSGIFPGYYATQDGWLYYSMGKDKLYKMPIGGTAGEIVLLADFGYGTSVSNINVVGDWIYLAAERQIYKLRTDGSMQERLLDYNCYYGNFYVIGDRLYLSYAKRLDASTEIYTIGYYDLTEGMFHELVMNPPNRSFFIANDEIWIQYEILYNDRGRRAGYVYWLYDLDGISVYSTEVSTIACFCEGEAVQFYSSCPAVSEGSTIYFGKSDGDKGLYRMDYMEMLERKINNDVPLRIMVWGDGYIYYTIDTVSTTYRIDDTIYRVRPDGSGFEEAYWLFPEY